MTDDAPPFETLILGIAVAAIVGLLVVAGYAIGHAMHGHGLHGPIGLVYLLYMATVVVGLSIICGSAPAQDPDTDDTS